MPKHYRPAGKKEGNAAKYITRTKAVNYLQVSLAIFRYPTSVCDITCVDGEHVEVKRIHNCRRWKLMALLSLISNKEADKSPDAKDNIQSDRREDAINQAKKDDNDIGTALMSRKQRGLYKAMKVLIMLSSETTSVPVKKGS
ncbi:hypothetical protein Zm00014a_039825 [Zea mays]|uniref:Uncharacterized protein n=1 Tax=Zea mays TaxID=4577 RepID=A0A3L6EV02_MAIZE|nr:hypothetical protein Zm00014a_039825 [Zea mays]